MIRSFGIFAVELLNNGSLPYPTLTTNESVVAYIVEGEIETIPRGVGEKLTELLTDCFQYKKINRSVFVLV